MVASWAPWTPITAHHVQQAVFRMKQTAAPGLDGLRPSDMRQMPVECHEAVAVLPNWMELHQAWPVAATEVVTVLIPKPSEAKKAPREVLTPVQAVLKLRPISLSPLFFRVWSAVRDASFRGWADGVAREHHCACQPGKSAVQAATFIATNAELKASGHGTAVAAMQCLILPRRSTHLICTCALDSCVALDFCCSVRMLWLLSTLSARRWRMGHHVTQPRHCARGMLQGCSWSVLAMMLLASLWARAVQGELRPDAGVGTVGYLDDRTVLTSQVRHMHHALTTARQFDRDARVRLNPARCDLLVFGTRTPAGHTAKCQVQRRVAQQDGPWAGVPVVAVAVVLGVARRQDSSLATVSCLARTRHAAVEARVRRVASLPLRPVETAGILESALVPAPTYTAHLQANVLHTMHTAPVCAHGASQSSLLSGCCVPGWCAQSQGWSYPRDAACCDGRACTRVGAASGSTAAFASLDSLKCAGCCTKSGILCAVAVTACFRGGGHGLCGRDSHPF